MYSEAVRREAMQRARDTAQPATSGRVQLVQEIDGQVQAGFLIYVPVYRGGAAPFTLEERRRRLIGFVYSPFRADDLMRGIFGSVPRRRADVAIYDGAIAPDNLLHRSPGFSNEAPWHTEVRQIDVAGRPWHIRYSTRPEFTLSSSRDLVPYVFLAGVLATLILAALTGAQVRAKQRADEAARAAEATARKLEVLHATASRFSAELDPERLIQEITDAGRALSEAEIGIFLHGPMQAGGEHRASFVVSGASREGLACIQTASTEDLFGPAFRIDTVVRAADITSDPRFANSGVLHQCPLERGPMRSYLAVPVVSRSGELLGGLLFGHAQPQVFTNDAERSILSLAGHAAIAIDNSRLFKASQEEIAARKKVEEHQKFLLDELNHRVKNTLATVQSIAAQTLRSSPEPAAFRKAFEARLIALSTAHDLLSRENWRGVMLHDLIRRELTPYGLEDPGRVSLNGERVWLPARISVPLGMAIHELATNAARHGALSSPKGRVDVQWHTHATASETMLSLTWQERGGPPVETPTRKGFGTRMIERGLKHDLHGDATLHFDPHGLRCVITMPLPSQQAVA
jgi:two-component sensor histidine kinase